MPLWHRLVVVGAVLLLTALVARLLDASIARRQLDPVQKARYRVLRRSVATTVVVVGVLSALLVIPQVRAVAGGLLASSAVIGLILGFASQRTIGNFVAGLLIAFTQPLRLGDRVEIEGDAGIVEDIGRVVDLLREASPDGEVLVTGIEGNATVTVREWTPDAASADRVASDLRLRAHERLRAAGVYA